MTTSPISGLMAEISGQNHAKPKFTTGEQARPERCLLYPNGAWESIGYGTGPAASACTIVPGSGSHARGCTHSHAHMHTQCKPYWAEHVSGPNYGSDGKSIGWAKTGVRGIDSLTRPLLEGARPLSDTQRNETTETTTGRDVLTNYY